MVNQEPRDYVIAARVPFTLKKLVTQFLARGTHLNESDLLRDAIREKIQREAPELYNPVFKRVTTNLQG